MPLKKTALKVSFQSSVHHKHTSTHSLGWRHKCAKKTKKNQKKTICMLDRVKQECVFACFSLKFVWTRAANRGNETCLEMKQSVTRLRDTQSESEHNEERRWKDTKERTGRSVFTIRSQTHTPMHAHTCTYTHIYTHTIRVMDVDGD